MNAADTDRGEVFHFRPIDGDIVLPAPLPLPRRVVTGIVKGKSTIVEDGPSPATLTNPDRPGFRNHNIWRTLGPGSPSNIADSITEHRGVLPPAGGTIIRVIDYPPLPADPAERRRQAESTFKKLFPDAAHLPDADQPAMHRTQTVDYAIVLAGTLTAILDDAHVELAAGDILIQRGTGHAWENRTKEMARVVFVLIAAG